jgi:glucose-fructose oxidoreductase
MIRATREANVKLMIAYRLHFERANLEVAKLARTGTLYDIGIYCMNAARYCLGEDPVEVWAAGTRSKDPRFREVDETVAAVMRFKDERVASFTCSFGAADKSVYSVTGTKGSVTLDPAFEYAVGLSYRLKIGERESRKKFSKSDQFAPELLYFSACVLNDREPEPSGEEGLADVQIIEAMLQSISSGRPVRVQLAQRQQRPTLRQEIRSAAVPREPRLVDVKPASQ